MRKQSHKELTWGAVAAFLVFVVILALVLFAAADVSDREAINSERIGSAYASGQLSNIEAVDGLR